MIRRCPKCGNKIVAGSNYCEKCGTRISYLRRRMLIKCLILLWIVALILCVTMFIQIGSISRFTSKVDELNRDIRLKYDSISLQENVLSAQHTKLDTLEIKVSNSVSAMSSKNDRKYVDLGLPSGTKWKNRNEEGMYHIDAAMKKYDNQLPTKEQFEELCSYCSMEWNDYGYIVTGPNGNRIFFPVTGVMEEYHCYGDAEFNLRNEGMYLYYKYSGMAYHPWVRLNSKGFQVGQTSSWERYAVRLVQKPLKRL